MRESFSLSSPIRCDSSFRSKCASPIIIDEGMIAALGQSVCVCVCMLNSVYEPLHVLEIYFFLNLCFSVQ